MRVGELLSWHYDCAGNTAEMLTALVMALDASCPFWQQV